MTYHLRAHFQTHTLSFGLRTLLIGGLSVTVSGCAITQYAHRYLMPLESVRRPAETQQRWGEYTISESEDGYTYRDDLIEALVVPAEGAFSISVENLTEHSVHLVWDEASYVDVHGLASGLSPAETRRIDVGRSRPPTVIPTNARIVTIAIPNVHIGDTRLRDFFEDEEDPDVLRGSELQLVLPFRVQGTVNEYTFIFSYQGLERVELRCDFWGGRCVPTGNAEGAEPQSDRFLRNWIPRGSAADERRSGR